MRYGPKYVDTQALVRAVQRDMALLQRLRVERERREQTQMKIALAAVVITAMLILGLLCR